MALQAPLYCVSASAQGRSSGPSSPMPAIGRACPRLPVPIAPVDPVSQPPSLSGWNVSADGRAAGHGKCVRIKYTPLHQSTTQDPRKKMTDARPSLARLSHSVLSRPPLPPSLAPPCLADQVSPHPLSVRCPPHPPAPCSLLGDSAELLS